MLGSLAQGLNQSLPNPVPGGANDALSLREGWGEGGGITAQITLNRARQRVSLRFTPRACYQSRRRAENGLLE